MENEQIFVAIDMLHSEHGVRSEAWSRDRATLTDALQRIPEITQLKRVEQPVEGARGGVAEMVATIAPAALTAIVMVVRAWVIKDKARNVKLRVKKVDGEQVEIDIGLMNDATVERIMTSVLKPRAG